MCNCNFFFVFLLLFRLFVLVSRRGKKGVSGVFGVRLGDLGSALLLLLLLLQLSGDMKYGIFMILWPGRRGRRGDMGLPGGITTTSAPPPATTFFFHTLFTPRYIPVHLHRIGGGGGGLLYHEIRGKNSGNEREGREREKWAETK